MGGTFLCWMGWGYIRLRRLTHPKISYLVVDTIAKRREPFANCSDTLVVLELIGENFTIRPVIPVFDVVNKSPI